MSRTARILSKTGLYHIIFKGMSGQDIFEQENDYQKLLDIIKKVKEEKLFELYAYCLMSNHVHLFLKENNIGDIKKIMHKILTTYVGWFNFKYQRSGSLIANRYKSEPIEDDVYFMTLLRYIHQNPLKAGMVVDLNGYKWSSYRAYIKGKSDIVDVEFALKMFNDNDKATTNNFVKFHSLSADEDFEISEKIKLLDEQLRRKMMKVLKLDNLSQIKSKSKTERNNMIIELRKSGFSIREIERITGISRGIIYKANLK